MPAPQMSAGSRQGDSPLSTSGAAYMSVPTAKGPLSSTLQATLKSMSMTLLRSSDDRTLSGFMSRCTMPRSCMWPTASIICLPSTWATSSLKPSGCARMVFQRLYPSKRLSTSMVWLGSTIRSIARTMAGWSRSRSISYSAHADARVSGSLERVLFKATSWLSLVRTACCTKDMEPWPRLRTTRNPWSSAAEVMERFGRR
mmetsp:Transcript_10090/g.29837  ORF Transcript_10090/g.29837 Transcript_10090/m.29837 type:complete len:200 (-) Transcript_10090:603-1202(-)